MYQLNEEENYTTHNTNKLVLSINKILHSNFRTIEPYFHVTSVLITLAGLPPINELGSLNTSLTTELAAITHPSAIFVPL